MWFAFGLIRRLFRHLTSSLSGLLQSIIPFERIKALFDVKSKRKPYWMCDCCMNKLQSMGYLRCSIDVGLESCIVPKNTLWGMNIIRSMCSRSLLIIFFWLLIFYFCYRTVFRCRTHKGDYITLGHVNVAWISTNCIVKSDCFSANIWLFGVFEMRMHFIFFCNEKLICELYCSRSYHRNNGVPFFKYGFQKKTWMCGCIILMIYRSKNVLTFAIVPIFIPNA